MKDKDEASHEVTHTERLRVFLCYSSGDKPQVRELYQRLRHDGFQPWMDKADLLVGQEWQSEIEKAVRASHVVIVCLSKMSVSKVGFVQRERHFALEVAEEQPEDQIFIIPVRLEPCEIPRQLQKKHCANLFEEDGYSRLKKALRVCASKRELFTPEPEAENDTRRASTNKEDYVEPLSRPLEISAVRPMPAPRPVRPRVDGPRNDKKARSKLLPLLAAVVFVTICLILGFSISNGRSENPAELPPSNSAVNYFVPSEPVRPDPTLLPEQRAEQTSEQPPATPTPDEPQAKLVQIENKNKVPTVTPDDTAPPTPKPPSSLSRYTIDVFLTNNSRGQMAFVKDIERRLKQYESRVRFRPEPFRSVRGCQIFYFNAGKGDARNEDVAANELKRQLNNLYPIVDFKMFKVTKEDSVTPNIISLVIGSGCKR
jgi:hypothetical protein